MTNPPVRERRIRSVVALGALVALVAVGLVIDAQLDPPAVSVETIEQGPLLAGSTTCAAVVTGPGIGTTVATIADATGEISDPEPWASLDVGSEGSRRALPDPDVTGRVLTSIVNGDGNEDDVLLHARWESSPLLMARRWEQGASARVQGAVEGMCPAGAAPRWFVPGVATAGGAAATLHLANPSDVPASLAVTFTTPAGRVSPTRLANVVVPSRGRTTIALNEFAPEEPDLGVEVTTRTGTVVVEAVQTLEAAVGGIDGHSLVAAHTTPSTTWTLPWVSAAEGESAWVWVSNPGDRPTDVRVVLHTSNGPVVPPAAALTLAPGTTQRLDLRGALSEASRGGMTLRSTDGAPVVVSGAVLRSAEDDPLRAGIAVVEAIRGEDVGVGRAAALSTIGEEGRSRFLAVANPGDEPATVDVFVVGRNAISPRVLSSGLVLPPGSWTVLDLAGTIPIDGGFGVVLDTREGQTVAAIVSESLEGPLDLTSTLARPFLGTVEALRVPVRADRGLLHPIIEPSAEPAAEPTVRPTIIPEDP